MATESRRGGNTCAEQATAGEQAASGTSEAGAEEAVLAALRRQLQPHLLAALHAQNTRLHATTDQVRQLELNKIYQN